MYNKIGIKIKVAAKVIAWIGIIGSTIAGIFLMSYKPFVITGLGVLLGGSFISWILSWFMYGYGELIEKTTEIAKNTANSFYRNQTKVTH